METNGWLPGYTRYGIPGRPGGEYRDGSVAKVVLHTTEGPTAAGALGAYRAGTGCPHVTVDLGRKLFYQHVPLTKHAYALRNETSGGETNRERAYQVEIVGYAQDTPDQDIDWYMRLAYDVIRPIMDMMGDVQIVFPQFGFGGSERYGQGKKGRMGRPQWEAFNGICGHQHVPENTHWDPGKLDDVLLGALLKQEDGQMAYFEKYSDPEVGKEYIVSQKRDGKIVFRPFSQPRGDGFEMKGLSIVLGEWSAKGIVQEV